MSGAGADGRIAHNHTCLERGKTMGLFSPVTIRVVTSVRKSDSEEKLEVTTVELVLPVGTKMQSEETNEIDIAAKLGE